MRRPLALVGIVAVALSLGGTAALAQDAAPIVPAPNQCTVEPRDIAFFQQMVGTPSAAEAAPADEATPDAAFQMPEGEPVDRATRIGVLDTVRQLLACLNAGDFLRFYALYTDDYIAAQLAADGPLPEEDLAALSTTPEPLPADNLAALLAIVDLRLLPDGRVAGLFDLNDPFEEPPGPARFLFTFVEQDGRWLIDEEVMLGPIDPAQVGTPPA